MNAELQNLEAPRGRGKRMDEIGWALLLIMTGALWLAPEAWAPKGAWLTGVGLILLGQSAARWMYRLRVDAFGTVAGAAALVAGIGQISGVTLPIAPLLFIVLGTAMILKVVTRTEKRDRAGRASPCGPCR